MQRDLIELPEFAKHILLKEKKCPYCQSGFREKDVSAVGVRRYHDGRAYFWFETVCHSCCHASSAMVTSRPMTTEGLCRALGDLNGPQEVDGMSGASPNRSKVVRPSIPASVLKLGSKITEEEMEAARRVL